MAAIAAIAFVLTDVAHEVVGHGAGFLLAGGRSGVFTTTRLIGTQPSGEIGGLIFDMGGPCGNLVWAGVAWLLLRKIRDGRWRWLLWLSMCFSLFWESGYVLFSGVMARGDWWALVNGRPYEWVWRALYCVAGFLLYRAVVRLARGSAPGIRRLVVAAYLSGGVVASLGALFDPRGVSEVWNSGALSSFGAAAGLLWIPSSVEPMAVRRSWGWIAAAVLMGFWYVAVLGPGIAWHL